MRRLLALVAWATLAAVACWLVEPAYRAWLLGVVNGVLRAVGLRTLAALRLPVPYDLGLFLALCLATPGVTRGKRARALALGTLAMVALEVGVVVLGLAIQLAAAGHAWTAGVGERMNAGLLHTLQLASAPLLWVLLLEGRALRLPAPRRPVPGPSRVDARGSGRARRPGVAPSRIT